MARAHFVKAAAKDYPAHEIKKGYSYYWWKFKHGRLWGPKQYSKTQPKPSQLTQSAFFQSVYELNDRVSSLGGLDKEDERDSIAEDIDNLASEQDEKLQNMPDSLQSGPSGELPQSRFDSCKQWAQELRDVDLDSEGAAEDLASCEYSGE